jgi:hypothetical protein
VKRFEPLTCRLQVVRPRAPSALAATMTQVIALMAPAALGLFCASSHEPFHADGGQKSMAVTGRSGQKPPQRRRNFPWFDRTVDQVVTPPDRVVRGSSGAAARHRSRSGVMLAERSDRDLSRDRRVQHAEPLRGGWPRPVRITDRPGRRPTTFRSANSGLACRTATACRLPTRWPCRGSRSTPGLRTPARTPRPRAGCPRMTPARRW